MRWLPYFVFVILFTGFVPAVVPTEGIQAVRLRTESDSSTLSDADKAVIDKFILSALNDLFLSKTSEETAKTRRQIHEQKGTKDLSLYATTYLSILREHLRTSGYTAVQRIEDPARQLTVRRNLMILVSELGSLLLVEFGLDRVEDPDVVIRYWAVKSLTNKAIARQLNSEVTANPEAADQIYQKLQGIVRNEKQPEILVLVADFAAVWKDLRAVELLQQMAARRIEDYQNCTFHFPWIDGRILSALCDKYQSQKLPEEKAKTGRSFAELLAVVMQRFMQEQSKPQEQKTLSEESVFQLITVIVEVEDRILPRLEIPTVRLKQSLEGQRSIQPMYEELFGTETKRGTIQTRLGFNYGQDASGRAMTSPPVLPPCPPAGSTETQG